MFFEWVEPSTTVNIYSIIFVLPSGVDYNKFKLNVIENRTVELTVEWPKALRCPETMHRIWINTESDAGSQSVLKSLEESIHGKRFKGF